MSSKGSIFRNSRKKKERRRSRRKSLTATHSLSQSLSQSSAAPSQPHPSNLADHATPNLAHPQTSTIAEISAMLVVQIRHNISTTYYNTIQHMQPNADKKGGAEIDRQASRLYYSMVGRSSARNGLSASPTLYIRCIAKKENSRQLPQKLPHD
ncbi:hypothetical protein GGI35DRAFT_137569 [Trichoderma velutinum]